MPDKTLISEAYRKQNSELHKSPKFGHHGHKWVHDIVNVLGHYECESVLDYGCGKGTLSQALAHRAIKEYDPAIIDKQNAEPADLVVCTDVLEHIEPDYLDNVLEHLSSMTGKVLFFAISTKLAKNHLLPDGRNPHLSLHSADWWQSKMGKYFTIRCLTIEKNGLHGEATPIKELGEITSVSAMSDDVRNEHVRINSRSIKARLNDNVAAHDRRAVLVCYGPSLKKTWRTIPGSGDIFCVGASHKFLLEREIVPIACIDCDPRQRNVDQLGDPHKDVRYWLASCVDPSFMTKLQGHQVDLWHIHNGTSSEQAVWDIEPDGWLLIGGGSVGLRAISLLYSQGYRKFSIHGMDSSYADDREYAGSHLGPEKKNIIRIRCRDRWFTSNLSLIDYAKQFLSDLRLWEGASFEMHGDGLLQEMCKC